ncbi:MAG: DegT/DnrJ/EryC1/StrS family aminotransferase, partial [Campylobacterota bacterium]|nr:DegT/DnrJ/EryC1/StrS family aminotransferase [Campylobacterota bacterium]
MISQLKDHGASKSDIQRHKDGGSLLPEFNYAGFNYRMTDMQGSLGVCQMKKATRIMKQKRKIVKKYNKALSNISFLKTPYTPDNYTHGYQSYVCLFTNGESLESLTKKKIDLLNKKRNIFMKQLEAKGIATRQGTHAVHTLGYYKNKYNLKNKDFLMSYAADRLSIALPLYPQMTKDEFNYIIKEINRYIS